MTQGSASYDRIAITGILAVLGLFTYLYLQMVKKQKAYTQSIMNPVAAKNPTIGETIVAGYNKSIATLSPADIKKYAGWLDLIETQAIALKEVSRKEATTQMVYNAKVLKGMSDANLTAIINYWEGLRKKKILSANIFNIAYIDNTETLPALLRRIQDLSI